MEKRIIDEQKLENLIKDNIPKKLLNNYKEDSYFNIFNIIINKLDLEEVFIKKLTDILDKDKKIYNNLIDKLELLKEKEETFIKNNNITKKEESIKYYNKDEKEEKENYKYIKSLEEKSKLVKFNEHKFGIIGQHNIQVFDDNYKFITNLKIPIKHYIILKNGDILIKADSSNYIQYIDIQKFQIIKKYCVYSQNSIPLLSLDDGRIIFQNYFEGISIYEPKDNVYIISNFINKIPIGIHQLNDNSIIIFKFKYMLQYSIKDFKLMNVLENKYGNYKAVNFNDDIFIIYGGDEGAACTRSIIYFIDRKKFKILSCFDSRSRIDCLVSTNNILYASLYNRVTTNR